MRAVALVFREQGGEVRVLLVKSSSGKRYVLPGGHCKGGETFKQAARREAAEESGYKMVGGSEMSEPFEWQGERVQSVVFRNSYFMGPGEREAVWAPLEAAVRMLQWQRPAGEADQMIAALWAGVKQYRGERGAEENCTSSAERGVSIR